jgi:hypothetical protein
MMDVSPICFAWEWRCAVGRWDVNRVGAAQVAPGTRAAEQHTATKELCWHIQSLSRAAASYRGGGAGEGWWCRRIRQAKTANV